MCRNVYTGVDRLPEQYQLDADKEDFFQKYRTLEKYGYTSIKKVRVNVPFAGTMDAWDVSLTPKWTKDLGGLGNTLCLGEWKAQSVKDFTQPAEMDGVRVSQVTVTGTQAFTGWATDPRLRQLFRVTDLRPSAERTYTLVLKNSGWQVARVDE